MLNRVLVVVFQNGGTFIRNDANSVKEFFKQFFIEKSIRTVVSVVQTANILQEYHINIKSGLRDGVKAEKRHIITRSPACSAPEVHVPTIVPSRTSLGTSTSPALRINLGSERTL